MVIATCVIILSLHGVSSLKEKRSIVKSITARVSRQFNVAVAEVDFQDVWQTAAIGLVTIGNHAGHCHGRLEKAVQWIAETRPDIPIDDYYIEFR